MGTTKLTARGRGLTGELGAWSPRTTLADCGRSRVAAALGAWLLLAPVLWHFDAAATAWNSIVTGLGVIWLSASLLATGPWIWPPVDVTSLDSPPGKGL